MFNLFIKHDKTYVIQINNTITLNKLCDIISKKINIPKHFFFITIGGKVLDTIERIRLNPTIEELNNTDGSTFPYINPDTTLYIMIYANGPSFIKKLTQYNLLSNVLRVGFVKTKIHKKIKNKNLNKRINLIPIKRAAKINEITDMIFFLASEKNSYISNETITIAGGE